MFKVMCAMYGLGFWHGIKCIVDDREDEVYSLNCFVSFSIFALSYANIVILLVTLLAFRIVSGSLQVVFVSSCKYFWQKFETTFGQPLVSFETFLRQQSWGKMSWGKISLGQNVSGAKCPWGKMSPSL